MPTITSFPINTTTFEELELITDAQSTDSDGVMLYDDSVGVMKRMTKGELFKGKVIPIDDITGFLGIDYLQVSDRQQYHLNSFAPGGESGGGSLMWSSTLPKILHDGVRYFSPTVPMPADFDNEQDVQDYKDGVGEEFPADLGIFVLTSFSIQSSEFPAVDNAIVLFDGVSGNRVKNGPLVSNFIFGPEISEVGALATYDNLTGTLLANGPLPSTVGVNLIEFPDSASDGYFRKKNDNTLELLTGGQLKTNLSLNNVDNTSDSQKVASGPIFDALSLKADLESPSFTGNPTAPTPDADDDSESIATTEYVQGELSDRVQSVATIADLRAIEGVNDDQQVSLAGSDGMRGGLFRRVTDPSLIDDGVDIIRYAATNIYWIREDAGWYNDVHLLHPAIHGTEEITVYCDPVTGDDSTGDGTLGNPWRTLQKALDVCPRILLSQYVIDLRTSASNRGGLPAIYDEDVLLRDVHAPMSNPADPFLVGNGLRILGGGPTIGVHDPEDVQVRSFTCSGCTGISTPEVFGMYCYGKSPYYEQREYIASYGCQDPQFYNLAGAPPGDETALIRAYVGGVVVKGLDITGFRWGFWGKRGVTADLIDFVGACSAAQQAFRGDEGCHITVIDDQTTASDPRHKINYNYGTLIVDLYGIQRLRQMFYGYVRLGTELGLDAFAAGYNVEASAQQATAVGPQTRARGLNGTVYGAGATAGTGDNQTAIGPLASVSDSHANSTAVGNGAVTTAANQMKLGNSALTSVQTQSAYEVLGAGGSVYLKSPNGTRYALTIDNGGAVTVTAAP